MSAQNNTNPELLARALEISGEKGSFIATADASGTPHLAAGGALKHADGEDISVEFWFCPTALENIAANPAISVVCWDPDNDLGVQLTGEARRIQEIERMDGFGAKAETSKPFTQAEQRILLRIRHIREYSRFIEEKA